ncbi:MAG: right-handed parallel beta-helix repeat-containing protein [Candidatus Bathyarchaeota archaeon]|nr:MAG: right-handed parallel beta-helix repeat-containing protein [Candidatus Bathyarchaeota archaeon]
MNRRLVLVVTLPILLIGILGAAFRVQIVGASGTIYIRADGSVDPPTALISSLDNVTYTFTDNINESIFVERDDIIVDGANHTLQGTGIGTGIALTIGRSNVTIKNVEIKEFGLGIKLYEASNNTISGNNITDSRWYGIHVDSSSNQNTISGNHIANSENYGIYLEISSHNFLNRNLLEGNRYGFGVWGDELSHYIHSIDASNLVDGKPVYYLINQQGITISPSTHLAVGFLALINSTDTTVEGLTLTKNSPGLLIAYTNSTKIRDNNITDNKDGIYAYISSNNTISGNNITATSENGIDLYESSNNTISGNSIRDNDYGIYLDYSSSNTLSGNNITNNNRGVWLSWSSNITVSGNKIINSTYDGIQLDDSSNNAIIGNNITKNNIGIYLYDSSNITVSGNIIMSNDFGIYFEGSSNNSIYHNNFASNTMHVEDPGISITWDDGYPSGGNYWSDYTDEDLFSGPYQNETGSDGIWDHPFVIDENNQDNYPMVPEFSSLLLLPLFMTATLLVAILYKRKRSWEQF